MKELLKKFRLKHLLFLLGVIILIFFLKSLDLVAISKSLSSLTFSSVIIILLLTILSISLRAYRWQFLTSKASGENISFLFSFKSILGGVAAASLIPGRIELSKPLLLKHDFDIPISKSFPLMLIERLFDLFSVLIFLVLGLFFVHLDGATGQGQIRMLLVLLCLLIAGMLLSPVSVLKMLQKAAPRLPLPVSFRDKIALWCEQIISSFTAFNEKSFILVAAISVAAIILEIIRLWYILHFLTVSVPFMAVGFVLSSSVLIGVLSAIPGGIGVVEFSAANILSSLTGAYPPVIKSAILIDRMVAYYLLVAVGSLLLIFWKKKKEIVS
ncbi:MAG TPA: lysylphosphatidylglycerol synthase transmembrane domain-containing protein [Candidatus Nanoarchaeia archaeon]|nr:lysylphosphatidylglycerol synthase transmembrane domain-containing protein [Candidatus Nanoarchaeia archaeon]